MKKPVPVSNHLPAGARDLLVKASKTEPSPTDPHARSRAIDEAVREIRTKHPKLFR